MSTLAEKEATVLAALLQKAESGGTWTSEDWNTALTTAIKIADKFGEEIKRLKRIMPHIGKTCKYHNRNLPDGITESICAPGTDGFCHWWDSCSNDKWKLRK